MAGVGVAELAAFDAAGLVGFVGVAAVVGLVVLVDAAAAFGLAGAGTAEQFVGGGVDY